MRDDVDTVATLDTSALARGAFLEIHVGLAACQVAIARRNEIVWTG